MSSQYSEPRWDLYPAMSLLSSIPLLEANTNTAAHGLTAGDHLGDNVPQESSLGNFGGLWDFLNSSVPEAGMHAQPVLKYTVNDRTVAELSAAQLGKAVKWRDEIDGADLEDNVEPVKVSASNLRTQKRAERRARARERAKELYGTVGGDDTATDPESANELESLRRSPDRSSLIADLVGRPRPRARDTSSPPTSPSPPKAQLRTPKRELPVSNPFLWNSPAVPSQKSRLSITPQDGLTAAQRKAKLIKKLAQAFPDERQYLQNDGLHQPAFSQFNTSDRGVHVFIDISNISIGFHDCLKEGRGINKDIRVRRVPLDFHNLSLVLERGRPAAKRVLAGSDKTASIDQAKNLGYETNMLERVHKVKELTPKQKNRQAYFNGGTGYASASGLGETSGSETNNGYHSSSGPAYQQAKWVEQAVDEILHLKMLESIVDAREPDTIVLATGDAAEAEYSGGFMLQVERALEKGWIVELVSFSKNTSSLYTRPSFRQRWGSMFKLVQLDTFAEYMIDESVQNH